MKKEEDESVNKNRDGDEVKNGIQKKIYYKACRKVCINILTCSAQSFYPRIHPQDAVSGESSLLKFQ